MLTDGRPNKMTVPERLEEAAKTFEAKSKIYGDAYKHQGEILAALFRGKPVILRTAHEFTMYNLLSLKITKLNRFAFGLQNGEFHKDSIHDDGVYAFMLEQIGEDGES